MDQYGEGIKIKKKLIPKVITENGIRYLIYKGKKYKINSNATDEQIVKKLLRLMAKKAITRKITKKKKPTKRRTKRKPTKKKETAIDTSKYPTQSSISGRSGEAPKVPNTASSNLSTALMLSRPSYVPVPQSQASTQLSFDADKFKQEITDGVKKLLDNKPAVDVSKVSTKPKSFYLTDDSNVLKEISKDEVNDFLIDYRNKEIDKIDKEKIKLERELKEKQKDLYDAQTELERITGDSDLSKKEMTAKINMLNEEIDNKTSERDQLRELIEGLDIEKKSLQEVLIDLKQEIDQKQKDVQQLAEENTQLQAQNLASEILVNEAVTALNKTQQKDDNKLLEDYLTKSFTSMRKPDAQEILGIIVGDLADQDLSLDEYIIQKLNDPNFKYHKGKPGDKTKKLFETELQKYKKLTAPKKSKVSTPEESKVSTPEESIILPEPMEPEEEKKKSFLSKVISKITPTSTPSGSKTQKEKDSKKSKKSSKVDISITSSSPKASKKTEKKEEAIQTPPIVETVLPPEVISTTQTTIQEPEKELDESQKQELDQIIEKVTEEKQNKINKLTNAIKFYERKIRSLQNSITVEQYEQTIRAKEEKLLIAQSSSNPKIQALIPKIQQDIAEFNELLNKQKIANLEEINTINEKLQNAINELNELKQGSGKNKGGLWSDEILALMKQYAKKGFKGVFSIDELHKIPIKNKGETISFIMNTEPSNVVDGHWVGIFINDKNLEYYDPFGQEPSEEFRENIAPILKKLRKSDQKHQFKINRVRYQRSNSSNCGWFSMKFLVDRYKGKSFKQTTGFDKLTKVLKGENEIKKFKQSLKDFIYI